MFNRLYYFLQAHTNPTAFLSAALIAILFVGFAIPYNELVAGYFGFLGRFTFVYFGWFYVVAVSGLLIFLLWVALSRYGELRLGADDETPEYSTTTWFAMLFAAGIGTILMFWGVAEPLSHFANPPLADVEPQSIEAARQAMNTAMYHFGLHTWTIFTMPALAIAWFTYRKGLPMRISSIFQPWLGQRIHGPLGRIIDVFALVGTLFGVAVSMGLGALQLNSGMNAVFGLQVATSSQIILIVIATLIATVSVALGLDRGIRRLSEINIVMTMMVMLFVWAVGPTLLITSGVVQNFGAYMQNIVWMSFWTETYQDTDWQHRWTIFYWAWTISWAPFVGIFIARISRGRTIRQFVIGALGAPLLFTLIWFSVFGLAAMDQVLTDNPQLIEQVQDDVSVALFGFLQGYPLFFFSSGLSLVVIMIFLTTSADSAALVTDQLASDEGQQSHVYLRVFWTLMLGVLSGTLLLGGGLPALQNVITVLGFPFCVLLVMMALTLQKSLSADRRATALKVVDKEE